MNLITPRPWGQLLQQHPNCLRTLSRGVRENQGLALGFFGTGPSALEILRAISAGEVSLQIEATTLHSA